MKTVTHSTSQPKKNKTLWEEAKRRIPGGVNSPVRAFQAVGGTPLFMARGAGSKIYDVEGNAYIDYVMSWGPLILGHQHPVVQQKLQEALSQGTSFGAPTEGEVRLAEKIQGAMPHLEKIRLVNSGTEAVMTALRLARGYTGRDLIIKFEGCYHGHVDALLVKAGSGVLTHAVPDSAGVSASVSQTIRLAPFNDLEAVKTLFQKEGKQIAGIIVEPIPANMGVIPPQEGFLAGLRQLSKEYDCLLIFDEVLTGFRVGWGGATARVGVLPDLTTLGKIIGGGLPIGAVGGKDEIMSQLSPEGPVYQAGTLSGNPLSVAGGLATLDVLSQEGTYQRLEEKGAFLESAFQKAFSKYGITGCVHRIGSLLTPFLGVRVVSSFQDVQQVNRKKFSVFFHGALQEKLYFPPSPFEASFVSLSHTVEDLQETEQGVLRVLKDLA